MLPNHLRASPSEKKEQRFGLGSRLGGPPPPPSLCVTGAMCIQQRMDIPGRGTIAYCIFRPRQLRDTKKPPLVVLHGGPSVPSNYLIPLVNVVVDRSIVFYDQLGCGRSSRPSSNMQFEITEMVQDLSKLFKEWKLPSFHLYGHSFGGILAFEYMKTQPNDTNNNNNGKCLSVIMASVPTSTKIVQDESLRLYKELQADGIAHDEYEYDCDDDIDGKVPLQTQQQKLAESFRLKHECRLSQMPLALMDAYAQAGIASWRGLEAISDYVATRMDNNDKVNMPPTLFLSGEFDFVTVKCIEGWKDLLNCNDEEIRSEILHDCSHYGMLENENMYGEILSRFMNTYDPPK